MNGLDRRDFFRNSSLGLAAGLGTLTLAADAQLTEASGKVDDLLVGGVLVVPSAEPPAAWKPTEDNILGPYHRRGAPYRGKITPPLEPGELLVVRGRVWGFDTKKPLASATLDVWQANAAGRYDNDDPRNPPRPGVFHNRARLVTDESGYYEYETVKPGRYKIGPDKWRPAHIHYLIAAPGYKTLVTQLYFEGDPENGRDQFIKPSLIIPLSTVKVPSGQFQLGTFDIVLARAT
jgi:protocatechuate 3,4-dioxygenase beta subunit